MRQTFLWFHDQGIELPVNKSVDGRTKIVWQLPTQPFIKEVLTNPFYAGAYVYGRHRTEKVVEDGKIVTHIRGYYPPEQCRVFIPDHHEGYIDWQTYDENRRMIRSNGLNTEKDDAVTSVRAGQGLLAGLMRCGRCGRKLHVRYWGKSGTAARYLCKGDFDAGGKYCLAFGGSTVDKRLGQALLKVVSPLGVRASMAAIKRFNAKNDDQRRAMERQIEQTQYEVKRAFEQYNEVDPRHRLVAAELERRWNAKLEELESLKSKLAKIEQEAEVLSAQDRRRILQLREDFRSVWESEHCSAETKKKILRTVVEEVIVNLDDSGQVLRFIIHWKGGSHTEFQMQKPKSGAGQKTSLEDLDIIRRMAEHYGDDEIARVLTKLGRRTTRGKRWNEHRVRQTRGRYSIAGQKRSEPDPEILTLGQAAMYCHVSQTTIKRLVGSGLLEKKQVAPWAPWEIMRADLDSEPIRQIIERLRRTGKLVPKGDDSPAQKSLFE